MKVTICCLWNGAEYHVLDDGTEISMNQYHPGSDYVVDLACFFSPLASQYPPEKRVFVPGEPSTYMGFTTDLIAKMGNFYKGFILSWHKELKGLPQTRPFRMGSSWVSWATSLEEKKFGIGGIFSGKADGRFQEYAVRRKIISLEHEIKIPSMVYSPSRQWRGASFEYPQPSKKPALEYMYHFAVENCSEEGYFTEKVMDCFVTYSVPVYFGDPCIGDIFVPDGIIRLDPDNITTQVNLLTPELYHSKRDAIVENRKRAERYRHFEDNIVSHLKQYSGRS